MPRSYRGRIGLPLVVTTIHIWRIMYKNLFAPLLAFGMFCGVSSANADVQSLHVQFGGGCSSTNKTGSCTLKVAARGSSLDTEGVLFEHAPAAAGPYSLISKRPRNLSSSGRITARFKNIPVAGTCYRVTTADNGNAAPDVISNTVCVK